MDETRPFTRRPATVDLVSTDIVVALAASPDRDWTRGLQYPEDFELSWEDREQVELRVSEDETLGKILERAGREFGITRPPWAEGELEAADLAFVDFYRPEAQQLTFRREFPLIGEDGRASWPTDWHQVTYGELLRAGEAQVVAGDPRRIYLLVQPGIGNGLLSDFVTQAELWRQWWDVFKFVWEEVGDEALKGFGLWQLWKWLKSRRIDETPSIVERHMDAWREHGMRPDNLRDLLGAGPWTSGQVATLLACSESEAEALLLGYGCAKSQDGFWRKATDPTGQFMQDTIELLIGMPAADREAFRDFMAQRFREFQVTGQPPRLDWNQIHEIPEDRAAQEAQAERWRQWSEERYGGG